VSSSPELDVSPGEVVADVLVLALPSDPPELPSGLLVGEPVKSPSEGSLVPIVEPPLSAESADEPPSRAQASVQKRRMTARRWISTLAIVTPATAPST
jgi:hypothetical protein